MQIWFYQGSVAASLLKPLARQYRLLELPRPNGRAAGGANLPKPGEGPVVCVADAARGELGAMRRLATDPARFRLVVLLGDSRRPETAGSPDVFAWLPRRAAPALVERAIASAFDNMELARRERVLREELARTEREMEELNSIGVALSSEREIDVLFRLILDKSRQITGADAGSLYLVEYDGPRQQLRFKLTQNDSVQFPFQEFVLPITEQSMAGYVALRGEVLNLEDAYQIPGECPFRFNPVFDQKTGYRTKSVLTLPMKNPKGELLGVLQLINCKRDWTMPLVDAATVEREVIPFSDRAVRLALSLASQAAVAFEKNRLYEDIERLFEGFVEASVLAIEQRDPTTSGHSFRVSTLTLGLAEALERVETGILAGIRFTPEQMKEIRYAALLHDFGKVAVSEQVLVKAKKLYPHQLDGLRLRFDYIRKELEARSLERKLDLFLTADREQALAACGKVDAELARELDALDEFIRYIAEVNEPTVLPEGEFNRLSEIASRTYRDPRGSERPYLTEDEVRLLSIRKGSLDNDERKQIESHVVHTFNFLMRIPWTPEIRNIPQIALSHHELMDGTGYPYGLTGDRIPLQTRMMTVCDIYDALSAADRPYKRAVSTSRALDILDMMVRDGQLDSDLFRLFVDAKVFERTGVRVRA